MIRALVVPVEVCRKARQANPVCQFRDATTITDRCGGGEKSPMPCFQEKPLSFRYYATVPQTDTGSQVENTKALERTRVKELGKLAP